MAKDLSVKQRRFCEIYCANGFNATQAAIDAGYSKKTAKEMGYENLTKPHVVKYIEEYKSELSESTKITAEGILERLAIESGYNGEHTLPEDSTQSGRIQALKQMSEYTGGFDANKQKHEVVQVTHEDWLDSLK